MNKLKILTPVFVVFTLAFGYYSYVKGSDQSILKNERNVEIRLEKNDLIYKSGLNYTLFYSKESKNFYFIQHQGSIPLFTRMKLGNVEKNSISFINGDGQNQVKYEIDKDGVYGIAIIKGIENKVFNENSSWKDGDISEQIYCKCRDNSQHATSCTSGGTGSTACSQSLTTGVVTQSCDTKCGQTFYACCSID